MLTQKAKYGLKAMASLTAVEDGILINSSQIALQHKLPKKFLDSILLELRHAGFVTSRQGPAGGYALARAAAEISVGDIIRTLDGPLAPIRCASRTALELCKDCANPQTCQIRWAMTEVRDKIAAVLDRTTLKQFVQV